MIVYILLFIEWSWIIRHDFIICYVLCNSSRIEDDSS